MYLEGVVGPLNTLKMSLKHTTLITRKIYPWNYRRNIIITLLKQQLCQWFLFQTDVTMVVEGKQITRYVDKELDQFIVNN
jgi:hypothetical protein